MDDDLYGGDDGTADRRRCTGGERTANREAAKLYNDGYRVGKAHEEERLMQVGFDSGFERGVVVGKLCGELYGACRAAAATAAAAAAADPSQSSSPSPTAAAMARLEVLIFEDLPARGCDGPLDTAWLQELQATAAAVAPAAAAAMAGRLQELR